MIVIIWYQNERKLEDSSRRLFSHYDRWWMLKRKGINECVIGFIYVRSIYMYLYILVWLSDGSNLIPIINSCESEFLEPTGTDQPLFGRTLGWMNES